MWWDADDDGVGAGDDRRLLGLIRDLVGQWREGILPGVTAIGSTWNDRAQRVLFLGIDPRASDDAIAGLGFSTRGSIRRNGWLQRSPLIPLEAFATGRLPREVITSKGYAMPIGFMKPLGPRAIAQDGRIGSLGCAIMTPTGQFATTAGHAVDFGPSVRWRSDGWRRLIDRRVGDMAGETIATTCPQRPDGLPQALGVDLGILRLNAKAGPPLSGALSPADPRLIGVHHPCRWQGGVSGKHRGYVVASCFVHNDPAEPYYHSHFVNGDLELLAGRLGDSGSIVTDHAGAALGHLIGVDGYSRKGLYQSVWVQDLETALDYAREVLGPIQGTLGFG